MFTYDCLLAAALLTTPADTFSYSDTLGWFEPLRPSLVRLALRSEILDRRETTTRLAQPQSFHDDLSLLQSRFAELLHTPLLEECQRFPARARAIEFLEFNRSYRQDLIVHLSLDPVHAEELRSAVMETDQLYRIWEALRDARCEYYYVGVRRQALQLLRVLAGNEAFFSGQLPPHVPVWRLPEWK